MHMYKYALGIGRRVLRALVAEMASKMMLHVIEERLARRVDLSLAAGLSFGRVVRLDPRFEVGEDVRAQNFLHETLVVRRLECLLVIQPVAIGDWWSVSTCTMGTMCDTSQIVPRLRLFRLFLVRRLLQLTPRLQIPRLQ